MSAIFGIVNRNGTPVARSDLDAMRHAMATFGPDGSAIWADGPVGVGHLSRHNTPESLDEHLPLVDPARKTVLVAAARIDNRDALFADLAIPAAQQTGLGDGSLISKAYEMWGTDCPSKLVGDWAAAVWDGANNELFLARDHFGVSGIYFHSSESRFVFSSSLSGLFALEGVPRRPNRRRLDASEHAPRDPSETFYEEIFQLRSAHAMTVDATETKRWKYWDPHDCPAIQLDSDEKYTAAFLEIYTEAVRCRLRSHRPVATMLSGGLDSGSIAVLAAQLLAEQGKRLAAFTSVPLYDTTSTVPEGRSGDEAAHAQAICDFNGNIDLTLIRGASRTPLQALREWLDILGEPLGGGNSTWLLELFEAAQDRGFGAMLDGWGGNFTVSWAGNRPRYLRSLLRDGEWSAYIRDVKERRRVRMLAAWRMGVDVVITIIPARWLNRVRPPGLPRRHRPGTSRPRADTRHDPRVMPRHNVIKDVRNPGLQTYFEAGGGVTSSMFALGAAFGIEVRHPAMDRRVIEFCQGLPLDQFTRLGQDRLLIKRAMSGLMPDEVLWDTTRGLQSADLPQRLRADEVELQLVERDLQNSALGRELLNLPRLRVAIERICSSLDNRAYFESIVVCRAIIRGLFLRTFEAERSGDR